MAHLRMASQFRPDLPHLQYAIGILLQRGEELQDALKCHELAVAGEPSNVKFILAEASVLRKLGRGGEATAALERAVAVTAASATSIPSPSTLNASGAVPFKGDHGVATIATSDPSLTLGAIARYKLGQHLRSLGQFDRAVEAYRGCLSMDPGHVLAGFWLPATQRLVEEQQQLGNGNEVVARGTKCSDPGIGAIDVQVPTHPSIQMTPTTPSSCPRHNPTVVPQLPVVAPPEYVVGLYNSYASNFDTHLTVSLGYRTPQALRGAVEAALPGRRWIRCLDLGCGTGLSGQAVVSLCHRLIGIDLSPAMVERARVKGVYHRLIVGEVTSIVRSLIHTQGKGIGWDTPCEGEQGMDMERSTRRSCKARRKKAGEGEEENDGGGMEEEKRTEDAGGLDASSDLFISCDVFGYIGDLQHCFEALEQLAVGSTVFAFSAEALFMVGEGGGEFEARAEGKGGGEEGKWEGVHQEELATTEGVPPVATRVINIESQGTYELRGTGRFAHSRNYLEKLCAENGFRVLSVRTEVLRRQAGKPVWGYLFVTEKTGHEIA
ncbi:unnamed protein product [Choristocarpus tenellus]